MNVEKYLARIKYTGPTNTSPNVLKQICVCQLEQVPFDTLDMFGGPRKVLDLPAIYANVVDRMRGGYCYENNALFHWLLTSLGFKVDMLQAQAWAKEVRRFDPEFDHMLLLVTCDDDSKWLADVGWGASMSFKAPLPFVDMQEQAQMDGLFRLRLWEGGDGSFVLERKQKQVYNKTGNSLYKDKLFRDPQWEVIYRFDTIPRCLDDFKTMNEFQQDDPSGFLRNNTLCSRKIENGDVALWGWLVRTKRYVDPCTEEITSVEVAENEKELKELLLKYFEMKVDFEISVRNLHFRGI